MAHVAPRRAMGFTFFIAELRVFFPYDSIYPEQHLDSIALDV